MDKDIFKMSAFAKEQTGGNPAGVILNADELSELQMKQIAREIGYSETAFVMKSDKADFRVRFFTPVDEVDLCGHATIATFNLLRDLRIIKIGIYTQETKAGILKVKVHNNSVYMEQNKPKFYELININEIQHCFFSENKNYIGKLPIQIVSTGLRDILLPIKSLEILLQLKPNFKLISELSKRHNAIGIHAFCLDTYNNSSAHCRNFAPLFGIEEESATGTSNGALACYLNQYNKDRFNSKFIFEQGYSMGKPSEVKAKLEYNNGVIEEVYVGGNASRLNMIKIHTERLREYSV